MGPIKLGVIGAGSAEFSAGMVRDICTTPSLAGSSVVLMDIDEGRAQTMHRFAQRYAGELGSDVASSGRPTEKPRCATQTSSSTARRSAATARSSVSAPGVRTAATTAASA